MLRNVKVLFIVVMFLTIFSYTANAKSGADTKAESPEAGKETATGMVISEMITNNADKQKNNTIKDIKLIVDGETQIINTPLGTVGELISSLPLEDGSSYDFSFGIEGRKLTDGMQINLRTKKVVYTTQAEEIPFEESQQPNENMLIGETRVAQEGVNGLKENKIREVYISGNLFNSFVESFEVITEPIAHIVEYGTKEPENLVAGHEYTKVISVNATAYTAYSANARTATGIKPYEGCVSVDPKLIPLGTKLYVEGYGLAVAADTGGSIKGNKVDLYYDTYNECINFGRQTIKVYVLSKQ